MDPSKRARPEYRRRWKAAKHSLENLHPSSYDTDGSDQEIIAFDSVECICNSDTLSAENLNCNVTDENIHSCVEDSNNPSIQENENFSIQHEPGGSNKRNTEVFEASDDKPVWDGIDKHQLHVTLSSDNSDYDLSSDSDNSETLSNDLASWANAFQIQHNAVDALLKVLRKHGHPCLPKTARTLLKISGNVETEICSGMEYKKLATNVVWGEFSMKGQKGKRPFSKMILCKVIISRYKKNRSASNYAITVICLHQYYIVMC